MKFPLRAPWRQNNCDLARIGKIHPFIFLDYGKKKMNLKILLMLFACPTINHKLHLISSIDLLCLEDMLFILDNQVPMRCVLFQRGETLDRFSFRLDQITLQLNQVFWTRKRRGVHYQLTSQFSRNNLRSKPFLYGNSVPSSFFFSSCEDTYGHLSLMGDVKEQRE